MKKITLLLAVACSFTTFGQVPEDTLVLKKLSDQIMLHGQCYEDLRVLCKTVGHRLSGSPQAEKAVVWAQQTLKDAGADTVWLQPVDVPVWIRGAEYFKVQVNEGSWIDMPVLSLGNTEGSGGVALSKEVVCVGDFAAFDSLPASAVKNKIIFFNYKFRQDLVNTFEGYGDAVAYRWVAVNKAAAQGAAAVVIRSIGTNLDDEAHTGSSRYDEGITPIPAMALGNASADLLAQQCAKGKVAAQLMSNCGMKGTARSYNVIGELWGKVHADQYIVVSGHLDSWDVGEGAHDDGAGCVQAIEVIRTFKNLDIAPRNSIRAVMYMNEENGVKGGLAYADSALNRNEKHLFAMESDAGGFVPRGVSLDMSETLKKKVQSWAPLFLPYGVHDFDKEGGGVDIDPLKKQNVPLAGLLPDGQRYFELHHTHADVFEAVNHRELKLGAWTMAAMIYLVDKEF